VFEVRNNGNHGAASRGTSSSRIALLRMDPALAAAIPAGERPRVVRALTASCHSYPPGPVDVCGTQLPPATIGVLVIDGSLIQQTGVGGGTMTELVLGGDVLLPWQPSPTAPESVVRFAAVEDVRLAFLDHCFIKAAARWPELLAVTHRRLCDQKHRVAIQGAICQLPRVDQRLMAIMWHLAARIGKVTADGTVVPRRLTHDALGILVGARRPTVSIAVKSLHEGGHLIRRDDGTWLIPGAADASFNDLVSNLDAV
jgi:CRP/FNR family transcriptional regulator, cyclic AMP receptor protein